MYKIVKVTDKDGKLKEDFMKDMQNSHPHMRGKVLHKNMLGPGTCLCLVWDDDSGKMLKTSVIVDEVVKKENYMIITTLNSVYTLEVYGG